MTTSSLACCIVTWDHHQQKELTPLNPLQRKCGMRFARRKAANALPPNDIVALIRCSGGPQPKFFDRLAALAQECSVDVQIVELPEFVNEIVHQQVIDILDWTQKLRSRTVKNFERRMIASKKGH